MNLFGLHWEDPWVFLGLLAVPLMLARLATLGGQGRVPLPSAQGLPGVHRGVLARLWWLPGALRILAVGVLVVAAARPQTEERRVVSGEGVDMMVALDMSASMNAVDMTKKDLMAVLEKGEIPGNRFEVARDLLQRFIVDRESDRVGLVVFGPQAWLKYPLTQDYARLVATLEDLVLDEGLADPRTGKCVNACTISGAGTAIGDALGRAYNRLRRSTADTKLILLITDGKQEAGSLDPLAIARHLAGLPADERPLVFTFLVGDPSETWMVSRTLTGRAQTDRDGRPIYERPGRPYPTDPDLLRQIAELTGGRFYESYNEAKFREDIEDLERTVFKTEVHVARSDVFGPLLLIGFLLFACEWLLRTTRFRSVA